MVRKYLKCLTQSKTIKDPLGSFELHTKCIGLIFSKMISYNCGSLDKEGKGIINSLKSMVMHYGGWITHLI